jgi:hypothetical protein
MRKFSLSLTLLAGFALPLAAQAPMPWTTEIGLRSAYTVTSVADDDITGIGFPGSSGYLGLGGISGVYATIPVGGRFAVEPGIGLSDLQASGTAITTVNASARVLFSAWRGLYVGAGPTLTMTQFMGEQFSNFGGQVAAGYRFPIGGSLVGRGEVYYEMNGESEIIGNEDYTTYGIALGLGFTPNAPSAGAASSSDGLWQWVLGFQGGYQHTVADGSVFTSFALPGTQNQVIALGGALPGVAPLFAQIPITRNIALEPSISYSSFEIEGSSEMSAYGVGLRANYAFNKVLYAGVSADYAGYGGDLDIDGTTGFGAAFGARFPIAGGISGRTEVTWRDMSGDDAFIGDFTVTSLNFGLMAAFR